MRTTFLTALEWTLALVLFGLMSFLASPAHSAELDDQKRDAERAVASQRAQLESACGSSVRVTVDWPSFERAYVDSFTPETAAAYCGEVVHAIADACTVTPAIRAKVKGVACRYGTPVQGTVGFRAASGGALDATFEWEGFGLYDESREWLHQYAIAGAVAKAPAKKPK